MSLQDIINGLSEDVSERCLDDKGQQPMYCLKEGDAYICLYSGNRDRRKLRCPFMGEHQIPIDVPDIQGGLYCQCWYYVANRK